MSMTPRYQEYLITDMQSLIDWKNQLKAILLTQNAWQAIDYPEYCPTMISDIALGWMALTLHPHQRSFASGFDNADQLMQKIWYIVTFYPGEVVQQMQDYVDESNYRQSAMESYGGHRRERRELYKVGILELC
jgi:hypothetical protein